MKYLKYLGYVIRHKWFVFIECCKLGIPFRGIIHDLSKILPSEFRAYANYFYGYKFPDAQWHGDTRDRIRWECTESGIAAVFDLAWLKHQNRNKHHWQYWLLQEDNPDGEWHFENPGDGYEPTWIVGNKDRIKLTVLQSDQPEEWLTYPDKGIGSKGDWGFQGFMPEQSFKVARHMMNILNSKYKAIPMPEKYCKEMLADWRGAGKAIHGVDDTYAWYKKNQDKMILHPSTRIWIETALKESEE